MLAAFRPFLAGSDGHTAQLLSSVIAFGYCLLVNLAIASVSLSQERVGGGEHVL